MHFFPFSDPKWPLFVNICVKYGKVFLWNLFGGRRGCSVQKRRASQEEGLGECRTLPETAPKEALGRKVKWQIWGSCLENRPHSESLLCIYVILTLPSLFRCWNHRTVEGFLAHRRTRDHARLCSMNSSDASVSVSVIRGFAGLLWCLGHHSLSLFFN